LKTHGFDKEVAELARAVAVPLHVAEDMLVALSTASELMDPTSSTRATLDVSLLPATFLPTLLELYRRLVAIREEQLANGVADRIVCVGELVAEAALKSSDTAESLATGKTELVAAPVALSTPKARSVTSRLELTLDANTSQAAPTVGAQ